MKRSEVKEQYKWNLDDLFYNVKEWEKEYAALNKESSQIVRFSGKLANRESLLECLRLLDGLSERMEKLYCYAMLLHDQDTADDGSNKLIGMAMSLLVSFNSDISFISPELSALDGTVLETYIYDPDFADYDYMLSNILREKKHILPAGEERILALGGQTFSAFSRIFGAIDNIELPFPVISVNGKREKMTHGKYSLWLSHKDPDVRKKAFNGMYKAIESLKNTIAANYAASVNKDNFLSSVRRYKSSLEKALSANNVPVDVYKNLIKSVNDNLDAVHDYIALRKKIMNVETLHMYDLYVPMFESELSLGYDEAYSLVVEGLSPLGDEYGALLKGAKEARWIDVEETDNKRSGAYSCGVAGVHPYVLLNHNATTHSIFTIAHEMGHALHSYYSSKNQPYSKADYVIFVAEIASTVNEVLLIKHLLAKTKDADLKKYLLSYYLDMFRTTVFRQTMFAEFEAIAHETEQKGSPLTVESLSKTYMKLNKKYYGKSVKHDKPIQYEWARIPHFYNAFYVYQYATGLISAVNIASDILSGGESAVKKYKRFLSAGGSKSPYEILKDCGVDLIDKQPYETAFGEFRKTLAELESL